MFFNASGSDVGMFTEFGDAVELLVDRGQQRVDYPHCLKSFGYDAICIPQ